MKVRLVSLLGFVWLMMLAGCVGDDAAGDVNGVVVAEPAEDSPDTTGATVDGSVGASDAAADGQTPLSVPDQLPAPEWADVGFVLRPVTSTDGGLAMAVRAGGDDIWVAERDGRVRLIPGSVLSGGGSDAADPAGTVVLDISPNVGTDGEGGLLGLDFSPDGDRLYLSYTDTDGDSVISAYEMDGSTPVEGSERFLLRVEQPFSNHNGGQITFGPDGLLYVAFGDGGSGGDPLGSGQDTSTLLGSILRIDPAGATADAPYAVPVDNPFVEEVDARDEIWLYGVRNPWRFSFDAESGDLWIGDVGQGEFEEIDFLPAANGEPAGGGANLGWNIMEGPQPFSDVPPPPDLVAPIAWYTHDNGRCSVTGGYVYRGDRIPVLEGVYVFGDYCTGEVFGVRRFDDGRTTQAPLGIDGDVGQIVSFGQGPDGELYVFESDGVLSRLENLATAADQ